MFTFLKFIGVACGVAKEGRMIHDGYDKAIDTKLTHFKSYLQGSFDWGRCQSYPCHIGSKTDCLYFPKHFLIICQYSCPIKYSKITKIPHHQKHISILIVHKVKMFPFSSIIFLLINFS